MIIVGNNAAGILNKKQSLMNCVSKYLPGALLIQESKCKRKGLIKINEYAVFEKKRKNVGGGGLLTAIHVSLEPVAVEASDDEHEVLVVEGKVGNLNVHFINAYGPQEEETGGDPEKIDKFYRYLDLVIKEALFSNRCICIQMDANVKLGPEVIPRDSKKQTKNGAKLLSIVEENGLVIVNALNLCVGTITRAR